MGLIEIGNDEFILYIRKRKTNSGLSNEVLGRKIWEWIRANDSNAIQIGNNMPALWGDQAANVNEYMLPKTATQFRFQRSLLVPLYNYLDTL